MRWDSLEDDEDLARLASQNSRRPPTKFISGRREQAIARESGSGTISKGLDSKGSIRWWSLVPADSPAEGEHESSYEGAETSGGVTMRGSPDAENENDINIAADYNDDNNDSLSATSQTGHLEQDIRPHNNHNRARNSLSSSHHRQGNSRAGDHQREQSSVGAGVEYFGDSAADRLGGLTKLVHKIAPELGCYTSVGEHYRGALAQIADGRLCLSWDQARRHLSQSAANGAGFIFRGGEKWDDIHHNHCRNPTMDPRGPWCFVQYEHDIDLAMVSSSLMLRAIVISGSSSEGAAAANGTGNEFVQQRYIQRHCPVAPCSEYLWLYIVAPPLGLLLLLSCLISVIVRYFKRKSARCYVRSSRRPKALKFGIRKLLLANGGSFGPKKFTSSSANSCKKSSARYLDDDIFEIVDDIDWSDGTNQSLSPKSQESLKLSATAASGDDSDSQQLPKRVNGPPGSGASRIHPTPSNCLAARQPRQSGQVGPLFATLRCHARSGLKTGINKQAHGCTLNRSNKSSTFIEHCETSDKSHSGMWLNKSPTMTPKANSISPKAARSSSFSSSINDSIGQQAAGNPSVAIAASGHLISCSTTAEDIESFDGRENCTRACDLPLINPSGITIATNQQQPLYEGKFSQVQLAFVKRQTACNNESYRKDSSVQSNDIGAQVALCAIKLNANLDESIFEPASLKLRNLNHLNILKLIGYSTHTENEIGLRQNTCALIYDMGQLVDLNDWLRQQSKDILISCEPGGELGVRRNLACFAKQIALAVDYLHDRGIIYKDLACRNCFLDPTKMLIKLASFNLEFASHFICESDELNSLRSMIRPKYLLDYYVIDSRPTDSQLLPLSWIPLESILFNKFNMQTDVWSFGCLLYELFSLGEVAYFGYSSKQVIDAVRSNLMPPQPLLCPNGIYKLMCKCLNDIPSMRPNVKQIYEQLNLYSGQCSSFLDHHLCSLSGSAANEQHNSRDTSVIQLDASTDFRSNSKYDSQGSITKTRSYANIRNCIIPETSSRAHEIDAANRIGLNVPRPKPEVAKIPLSKSINLTSSRMNSLASQSRGCVAETSHYDEPIVDKRG